MRYLLLILLLCVGCGSAPNEPDTSVFLDGDVQDFSVRDQDLLDGGMEDGTVPIDIGRGTVGTGGACSDDLDCQGAYLYCDGLSTCQFRQDYVPCDRYVTGNMLNERLCGTSDNGLVRPLDVNVIPATWAWCNDLSHLSCGEQSCGFRCQAAADVDGNISVPSCLTDSDCAGHFVNPDCYFNTCRTLNCPTPLQTTGCQAGEICSGLNLCVPGP